MFQMSYDRTQRTAAGLGFRGRKMAAAKRLFHDGERKRRKISKITEHTKRDQAAIWPVTALSFARVIVRRFLIRCFSRSVVASPISSFRLRMVCSRAP